MRQAVTTHLLNASLTEANILTARKSEKTEIKTTAGIRLWKPLRHPSPVNRNMMEDLACVNAL